MRLGNKLFLVLLVGIISTGAVSQLNVKEFFEDIITMSGNGHVKVPAGTTAQRTGVVPGSLRYNSDENSFEGYTDSWGAIGGGSGSGINYLADTKDSDFEISIGSWIAFNDGAVSVPVDGTGGTAVWTCTQNTTTPLRLTGDMQMVAAASDMQGEGCSVDFDVDLGMQAQKLTGSFWYNFSDNGFNDDEVGVFIYDKTNANLIRVNGEDLKGGEGRHFFQFQTASNSTSYRLIVMQTDLTNVTGFSIYFDEVAIGPTNLARSDISKQYSEGAGDFTVTGTAWTTTRAVIVPYMTAGGAWRATINIDGTQTTATSNTYTISGITFKNSGFQTFSVRDTDTRALATSNTGDVLWNSDTTRASISFSGDVELESKPAWATSYTNMSSDLGGREIVVAASKDDAQPIPNATFTTLLYDDETKDTTSSYNSITGEFTAPETGDYIVGASIMYASTSWTAGNSTLLSVFIGGVEYCRLSSDVKATYTGLAGTNGTQTVPLNKGEILTVRAYQSTGGSVNILNANAVVNWLSISKLASPQTTLETATLVFKATDGSGQTVNSTQSTMSWDTVITDTHGNFSSNVYTINENGNYRISAKLLTGSATWAAANSVTLVIYKNGATEISRDFLRVQAALTTSLPHRTSETFPLVKGDTIEIQAAASQSSTINTSSTFSDFAIYRIK